MTDGSGHEASGAFAFVMLAFVGPHTVITVGLVVIRRRKRTILRKETHSKIG